jgi:SRSO17 transposase
MDADQIRSLRPAMAAFVERYGEFFNRRATFEHFQRYVLGLLADLDRKSVEPIALAAGVAVRTLQEFLAFFKWDHDRVRARLQRDIADAHGASASEGIGVIDASAHPKRGDKTPGVQRQYCGETGKIDNCVVGQHLLYTDNHATNPFSCVLASDLYLPRSWAEDRAAGGTRCKQAGIPDELTYRPKWKIATEQVAEAIGRGVRFAWITFDEEYGSVPGFWFELDRLGQRGVGEVKRSFTAWVTRPACRSLRPEHAPRRVEHLATHSPAFRDQPWRKMTIKDATRGPIVWQYKHAMIHLVEHDPDASGSAPVPTDRRYWLVVARHARTGETKYFVSNAAADASIEPMLRAAFARWHVEKWFERAKQECGLGAFEVRTYTSLIRHWLCSTLAMLFLAEQTTRLRGEKSTHHLRAGRPRRQHPRVGHLEPLVA